MSSTSSRGQLVFRSSLLYVWVTRGPFGRLPKSLCDFGDMTPHTLVGGAQTTLTARASARGSTIIETAQMRPGDLRSRENPYPAPRRFGPARGAHRGRRYGPKVPDPIEWDQGGKGVNRVFRSVRLRQVYMQRGTRYIRRYLPTNDDETSTPRPDRPWD